MEGYNEQPIEPTSPESKESLPYTDYVFYYKNDLGINVISEPIAVRNDESFLSKFKELTGREYGEVGDGYHMIKPE